MSTGEPGGHPGAVIDFFGLILVSGIAIGIALFTTGIVSELLWIAAGVLEFVAFRRLWLASRKAG